MPTASTSQILGNNEAFEPYTSNVYTRRVLAGEFVCVNPHLVQDLIDLNLFNSDIKNTLMGCNGSIQSINGIPDHIKQLYKTVWEIPQKALLDLAISRGPYICQSQSLNIYMGEPNFGKMTSMHFYGWKNGLKTGQYYLRSKPSREAIKFTVDVEKLLSATDSGANEDILKCLALEKKKQEIEAAMRDKNESLTKTDEEMRQEQAEERQREFEESIARRQAEQEQEEDVVFECINCSG